MAASDGRTLVVAFHFSKRITSSIRRSTNSMATLRPALARIARAAVRMPARIARLE